jgi:hypothetical protein
MGSSPHRAATSGQIIIGPGSSLQIWNLGQDAAGFNVVAARAKVVFKQMNFCLDDGELVAEVSELVVIVPVSFNFGGCIPIVEIGDGAVEGVECGRGADEEGMEPDGHGLHRFRG